MGSRIENLAEIIISYRRQPHEDAVKRNQEDLARARNALAEARNDFDFVSYAGGDLQDKNDVVTALEQAKSRVDSLNDGTLPIDIHVKVLGQDLDFRISRRRNGLRGSGSANS